MNLRDRKYEWILFDADNTLFDFDKASYLAFRDLIDREGLLFLEAHYTRYYDINIEVWALFEDNKIDAIKLRTLRFERFFDEIRWEVDILSCSIYYLERLVHHTHIYDSTISLLGTLQDHYQLAIITNGLREVQRPRIHKLGLTSYFQQIIVSDEIGHSKPNEAFFAYTFNQIGSPPKEKSLVVGDSLRSDIAGGNRYNVDTCWYNPNKKENPTSISPNYEIGSHDELLTLLMI